MISNILLTIEDVDSKSKMSIGINAQIENFQLFSIYAFNKLLCKCYARDVMPTFYVCDLLPFHFPCSHFYFVVVIVFTI